jgi:hypothetical protein
MSAANDQNRWRSSSPVHPEQNALNALVRSHCWCEFESGAALLVAPVSFRSREMRGTDERPKFLLVLQPLPRVDPIRALRWALKRLLRDHGLRCVSVREESAGTDPMERR